MCYSCVHSNAVSGLCPSWRIHSTPVNHKALTAYALSKFRGGSCLREWVLLNMAFGHWSVAILKSVIRKFAIDPLWPQTSVSNCFCWVYLRNGSCLTNHGACHWRLYIRLTLLECNHDCQYIWLSYHTFCPPTPHPLPPPPCDKMRMHHRKKHEGGIEQIFVVRKTWKVLP